MLNVGKTWSFLLLGFLAFSGSSTADAAVPISWLQDNLVPNAGFEELAADGCTPKGWTIEIMPQGSAVVDADATDVLTGRRSLQIATADADGRATVSSPPIPVQGGAMYLAALAFRQKGFNAGGQAGKFEGVSSAAGVTWLDASQKAVGGVQLPLPCGPTQWDLRDALRQAPPIAHFAKIWITLGNNSRKQVGQTVPSTLWIDAVQLRKYLPPPTPDWAKRETAYIVEGGKEDTRLLSYFVGIDNAFQHMRGGRWSRIVDDPQAERGTALMASAHVGPGYMAHSPYWPALPAGLYRVRARVKIPAGQDAAPVGELNVDSEHAGVRQILPFVSSGETAGKYANVEADFILRDSGWWDFRIRTNGKQPWSIDSLKVFCLRDFDDRQLLALYPGIEGEIPAGLKPTPMGSGPSLKGLVVAGMGYERFRIADVFHLLHLNAKMTVVWLKGGKPEGLPENPRDLFQYSIIYLCNVDLRNMTLKDKNAIREYVKRGGALVVMGGQKGYERGGWHGSLIEEAMPVEAAAALPGGLICTPQGLPLKIDRKLSWLEDISTASSPLAYYLHTVTVKPSAQVLVQAGDRPFLVTGTYGQGRVVCILGVPWGDPGPHETGFWQWDDWVYLFREICWWAMKNPAVSAVESLDE